MRANQFITEGATSVLYHKTSLDAALEILTTGEFKLTSSLGNDSEAKMMPKGYPYYLSTTRSKVGDYHRYVGSTAVMFVLDGDKIGQNNLVKPVDYWSRMWQHNPERTRESEDRIFSKRNTLSADCIRAVHILVSEHNENRSEAARQLLIAAKTRGIRTYLYNDEKAWRLQDTRRAISPSEANDLLKGHRKQPMYMRRPVRGVGKGENAYGRSNILSWIELVMKQPGQQLSKNADKIRYNLQYYGDMSGQLKNDFFNAKRPGEPEYPLVVKLGDYMNKNNLDFLKLSEMLKQKWATKR
jgi:hypothetical protein